MSKDSLFLFAGERSGDLHGGHLVSALQKQNPNIQITGVAGPDMRSAGVKGPLVMEDFEVMGFSDVLFSLPKLLRHFRTVRDYILTSAPSITVLIDYPGFNLRLAKSLRKYGYKGKIVQYVSPTVWAHGSSRIQTMTSTLDLLLSIYPFEKTYFSRSTLEVEYIGNPLCDYLKHYSYNERWKERLSLPFSDQLIALFPGSRKNEIDRNLPLILGAAEKILEISPSTTFGLSIGNSSSLPYIQSAIDKCSPNLRTAITFVPKEFTYELMQGSRSSIAKSGTVTLELALHKCPTVVVYQLTPLNRLFARFILKLNLPNYCIVNILAKEEIFPELIAKTPTADTIFNSFQKINSDTADRRHCIKSCEQILNTLDKGASPSTLAATAILKLVSEGSIL